jgi:rod shape-determining protein MreD
MRKVTIYFFIYIVFCLLQLFFSQYLNIFGVYPNFILILVVYIGLLKGSLNAQLAGFLFGLTWDTFCTNIFATRAMLFTILGYCSGKLRKKFDEDSIVFHCVIIFIASLSYIIIMQDILTYNLDIVLKNVSKILINVVVAPCIFYVLRRLLKEE